MARLLQQILSPREPILSESASDAACARDDDVALGCECAYPSLQFDAWEPIPMPPHGPSPAR